MKIINVGDKYKCKVSHREWPNMVTSAYYGAVYTVEDFSEYGKVKFTNGHWWDIEFFPEDFELVEEFYSRIENIPIGLKPLSIVEKERTLEVLEAMHRYVKADQIVPKEWRTELVEKLIACEYFIKGNTNTEN